MSCRSAYSQKNPAMRASTHPLGGGSVGCTTTGCAETSANCCEVMCPRSCIRCSTSLRRVRAFVGSLSGLSSAGDCTRPASMAACGSVRSAAFTPK